MYGDNHYLIFMKCQINNFFKVFVMFELLNWKDLFISDGVMNFRLLKMRVILICKWMNLKSKELARCENISYSVPTFIFVNFFLKYSDEQDLFQQIISWFWPLCYWRPIWCFLRKYVVYHFVKYVHFHFIIVELDRNPAFTVLLQEHHITSKNMIIMEDFLLQYAHQ